METLWQVWQFAPSFDVVTILRRKDNHLRLYCETEVN